jgi:hypothetical protein
MNNGKRIMDNEKSLPRREKLSIVNYPLSIAQTCAACGAEIGREFAKYCRVCGKFLPEDYQPLDTLRASNRLHGKTVIAEKNRMEKAENLFEINENSVSQTAWACLVYSLVPYLGIVFVPLTMIVGSFGVFTSFQKPWLGGRKLSLATISLSLVVLAVQILLWWLLYIIPTLGR